jgi:hypothetical protein
MSTNFQNKQKNKHHKKQNKNKTKGSRAAAKQRPKAGRGKRSRGAFRGESKLNRYTGMVSNSGNRTTNRKLGHVEEDEFIADILGSVGFATTQFAVNPGLSTIHPWGSKTASLYSNYDYDYLEFYYKPEVSGNATQGQTGKVILSFDYNALATVPTTKQQVEATDPHVDDLPYVPLTLRIDCAQLRRDDGRFVRLGAAASGSDLRDYDAGILSVSTIGQTNASLVGELHVRYGMKLRKPLLDPSVVAGGAMHFSSIAATTANNFAAAVVQTGGTPSMANITLGTNTLVFPAGIPGNYALALTVAGATSASALGVSSNGNATALNLLTSAAVRDATYYVVSLAGTTTSPAMLCGTWTIPVGGATITFTASTIVGTGSMDLFIFSLPTTVLTSKNPSVQSENELARRLASLEAMIFGDRSRLSRRTLTYTSDDDEEPSYAENGPVREQRVRENLKPPGGGASASSPPVVAAPLSSSMLEVIGEYVSRKSASNKKE